MLVAIPSIRLRILKAPLVGGVPGALLRCNPLDPLEDTERLLNRRSPRLLSRCNPLDPLEDTERPGNNSFPPQLGDDRCNPLDPLEDTERTLRRRLLRPVLAVAIPSIRLRILKAWTAGGAVLISSVAIPSIRLRILKGRPSGSRMDSWLRSCNPLDPLEDTESLSPDANSTPTDFVAIPSIRLRILKVCCTDMLNSSRPVAIPSIRLRILKVIKTRMSIINPGVLQSPRSA